MRIKIQGCVEKRNEFERERVILKIQAVSPVGAQDIKMRNILCLRTGYSQSHNSHKLLSATLQGHDAKNKIHIHKLILSQITVIACGKSLLESSYHGKHIQYFREHFAGRKKRKVLWQRHDFSVETRQRIDWFYKKLLFMYKDGCPFFSRIQIQCTLFSIDPKSKAKQANKQINKGDFGL